MADHCIRQGATGNADGSDWTNAWTDLPATLTRGDTYYVADGQYAAYTFNDAVDGVNYIYIKKATNTAHGTETGWDVGGSYGDGEAEFEGVLTFSTDYWDFDGVTGGGPGAWTTGFGFVVDNEDGNQVVFGDVDYVHLRHADIQGISRASQVGQWGIYSVVGGTNQSLHYCRLSNQQKVSAAFYYVDNVTIEYCKLGPNGENGTTYVGGGAMHKIGLSLRDNATITVRYNIFEDISETCYLGVVNDDVGEVASNWSIYGNIFVETGNLANTTCSMLVNLGKPNTTLSNFLFYNNTITHMNPMGQLGLYTTMIDGGGNVAQNNLWYDNLGTIIDISAPFAGSYNYYNANFNSVTSADINNTGESNAQIATGNPFVNSVAGNYRLSLATTAGADVGSPYNEDMDGVTRGADGTWDRGAFDYVAPITGFVMVTN